MTSDSDDAALLWDMLQAARHARDFISGRTLSEYASDILLRSAVERQIEIIGEAARYVSTELREAQPEIPWRGIQAQRHVLAHDYGVIDNARLWKVVSEHIPVLIQQLESILPQCPADGQ